MRLLISGDEGTGTLAAVRGLRAAGHDVWLAVSRDDTYAARSRTVAGVLRVADPAADPERHVRALCQAARTLAVVAVLPGTEGSLRALAGRERAFGAGVAVGTCTAEILDRATDKRLLARLASEAGLEPAPTLDIAAPGVDLDALQFPGLVKPLRSIEEDDGLLRSTEVEWVQGAPDLRRLLANDSRHHHLFQPYLEGTLAAVCGVAWRGELACAVHQRSPRIWPVRKGISSYAVTVPADPAREAGVERLVRAIGWSGVFGVQFVVAGERAFVIDFNPRIYGSLGLAIAAGMNLPAVWVDLLLGRPVGRVSYRPGARYRVEEDDVRALLAMFGRGRRGEALRGLAPRRRTVHAVFSAADPRPFEVSIQKLAARVGRDGDTGGVTEPLAGLEAARGAWSGLAARGDNIFSTWEWAEVWWRHYGARGSLALRLADGGQVLLPMYVERRMGLRVTRFLGHGAADQLGPVCDPSNAAAALLTLRRAQIGDLVVAERVEADKQPEHLEGVVLREESSPVITCAEAGSWDAYLAMRSANFRQQVRRRERALARAGVRFRLATDRSRLPDDLDALIALHRTRWGPQSTAFSGARERFHRDFAQVALEQGWLRLWLAKAEGRVVAAWYGFRFANVEYFYQSGRDPAWDDLRVGAGVLEHSIREAFADGMREYRLLRGDERYKLRYATETRRVLTIAFAQTPVAHVLVPVTHALAAVPAGRTLLRRAAG